VSLEGRELGAFVALAVGTQTWGVRVEGSTCLDQTSRLAVLLGREVEIDIFADNGAKWRGKGQRE
jgi:hypothetical protein